MGTRAIIQVAEADPVNWAGEDDYRRALLGARESSQKLPADGGADFRIRLPRR